MEKCLPKYLRISVGQMAANCYIVNDIIIDPGDDAEYIMSRVTHPKAIIATHGHFDHIMAARAIQLAYNIPFYIHKDDVFLVKRMQESAKHFLGIESDPSPDVTAITKDTMFGLHILHTPGHTPGSICLVGDGVLFTGDTIFTDGGVGRTDHNYSSQIDLIQSIQKILTFDNEIRLLPGHGKSTTVGRERPFHVQ